MNKINIDLALLEAAKENDEMAMATIVAQEMPTIRYFAYDAVRPGLDFDDAVQEGLIGLFGAIQSYNPTKAASFATYASTCIQNAIISAQRSAGRKKHSPLNQSVPIPEEESIPGPEEIAIAGEKVDDILNKVRELLSPLERNVLLLYIEDFSYAEIAEKMNTTSKAVENALQRVRRKLK